MNNHPEQQPGAENTFSINQPVLPEAQPPQLQSQGLHIIQQRQPQQQETQQLQQQQQFQMQQQAQQLQQQQIQIQQQAQQLKQQTDLLLSIQHSLLPAAGLPGSAQQSQPIQQSVNYPSANTQQLHTQFQHPQVQRFQRPQLPRPQHAPPHQGSQLGAPLPFGFGESQGQPPPMSISVGGSVGYANSATSSGSGFGSHQSWNHGGGGGGVMGPRATVPIVASLSGSGTGNFHSGVGAPGLGSSSGHRTSEGHNSGSGRNISRSEFKHAPAGSGVVVGQAPQVPFFTEFTPPAIPLGPRTPPAKIHQADITPQLDPKDQGPKQLIVNYIPPMVEPVELFALFEQFGPLECVKIMLNQQNGESRGFGFVYFVNSADAAVASSDMQGFDIYGKTLSVGYAVPQRPLNHQRINRNEKRKSS